MSAATSLLLTPLALQGLARMSNQARKRRAMGSCMAFAYTAAAVLAYVVLPLEGRAWTRLRQRYGFWFSHITARPYQFADPLRIVLQALWIFLICPPDRETGLWWTVIQQRGRTLTSRVLLLRRGLLSKLHTTPSVVRNSPVIERSSSMLRRLSKAGRMGLFAGLGILAAVLALLLVTQPFNLYAQFIFVALLWGMAMVLRRMPGHVPTLMLIILSLTVSSRYIWWRYTSTLNVDDMMDLLFGSLLLAAETYSWVVLLMGYVQTAWPLRRRPVALPPNTDTWPTVDLMIPTYNEDLSIVKPTVYAALGMDWPSDKLRVHLLDDGRREAFRSFAQEVGIGYIVRPDGRHAKAGNLNHAMGQTDGELLAIFDCDHVPTRSFLQMTTGWFLKDPKLALVQTPHHFFSPDPFERNLGHFGTQPNENTLFYGLVQEGNDLWNAAFFCGSCAVLRRSALDAIGGFAVETVTEDAHTALRLHRRGYNSAYLRIPQAAGLATENLAAHIGQRIRWARGMVQIFRTDNPLWGKGLTLLQRLCYTNAMLHFLSGIPRIIYLTAPLAFLLLHSYILAAPALVILLNVLPHMVHAIITNSRMQGSYRRTFWAEIYETVLAWYIARPTTVALFAPNKGAFNVTSKGGLVEDGYFDWTISHPYVILAFANILGLLFGLWRLCFGPADEVLTVLITMLWVLYNLVILGGAVAVASEARQVRQNHRVQASLPAGLSLNNGHVLSVVLTDYSEGGVGLGLLGKREIAVGTQVQLLLARGDRRFSFPGQVRRQVDGNVGVLFDAFTRQQHIDFIQCTFARADSWLTWQDRFKLDKPVQGLRDIVILAFNGYKGLARQLPLPFSIVLRGASGLADFVMSLIPRSAPHRHPVP